MLHTPDTISTLRHLLTACRTIAVVGLSPQWHRPSYFAAKYMQAHGYRIVPVNPLVAREGGQILGETAYASVTDAAYEAAGAEITDAAMGERAECVMLNKGPYIVEAVTVLTNILQRMEQHQYKKTSQLRALHIAEHVFEEL